MCTQDFISPNVYTTVPTVPDGYVDGYKIIHTGVCYFVGGIFENTSGSTVWAQVFDGYQNPVANQVPVLQVKLAANSQVVLDLTNIKKVGLTTGLMVAASSTSSRYTDPSSRPLFMTVFYI